MDYENARVKAKNQGTLDNIHSLQRRYDIKLKEYEQVLAEYQLLQTSVKVDNKIVKDAMPYVKQGAARVNIDVEFDPETTRIPDSTIKGEVAEEAAVSKGISKILEKMRENEGVLIYLKDRMFWGQKSVRVSRTTDQNQCLAKCAGNKKCDGATFIPPKNSSAYTGTCYERSGEGSVKVRDGTYAIVNKMAVLTSTLLEINGQLISLNNQILDYNTSYSGTNLDVLSKSTDQGENKLTSRHNELVDQREILGVMKSEYANIGAGKQETGLVTRMNFYRYRFWYTLFLFVAFVAFLWSVGLPPIYVLILLGIYVVWFLGFGYVAIFSLFIYMLYYLYMIPDE